MVCAVALCLVSPVSLPRRRGSVKCRVGDLWMRSRKRQRWAWRWACEGVPRWSWGLSPPDLRESAEQGDGDRLGSRSEMDRGAEMGLEVGHSKIRTGRGQAA